MNIIEKIEQALILTCVENDNMTIDMDALECYVSEEDVDGELIKENVLSIIDFFNKSENKSELLTMEISDIMKLI
ncbi:hypothetical protein M0Q50_01335 [bacterium]|jgi:hypothetical protein|nr:hypothetical protein [bacterium]